MGPPHVPWIAPLIFAALIAIANVSHRLLLGLLSALCRDGVLMHAAAVLDIHGDNRLHDPGVLDSIHTFLLSGVLTRTGSLQAYGPYAASATGGNGFARDFLAGIAALYSVPRKLPSSLARSLPLLSYL